MRAAQDVQDGGGVLAPGTSFGADFATWVRLCFTCVPPGVTERGVEELAGRRFRRRG